MRTRAVRIFSGETFEVPASIQRIDSRSTHGWQVRYCKAEDRTKIFSDHTPDGSGAAASLAKAVAELHRRITQFPAPTGLRRRAHSTKKSALPPGISGPALRNGGGTGKTPYYCFQVSVPLPGGGNTTRSVYIGTERTRNDEREAAALAKAQQIREQAVEQVEQAATRARRAIVVETLATQA
jgi:hypothetical protein